MNNNLELIIIYIVFYLLMSHILSIDTTVSFYERNRT